MFEDACFSNEESEGMESCGNESDKLTIADLERVHDAKNFNPFLHWTPVWTLVLDLRMYICTGMAI